MTRAFVPRTASTNPGGGRSDATHVADEVERDALGREQAARGTLERRDRFARRDMGAVHPDDRGGDRGIDEAEGHEGEVEAGDDAGLTRGERNLRRNVARHDGVSGDVAGAAEILEQCCADDRLDERRGKRGERHFRLASGREPGRRCLGGVQRGLSGECAPRSPAAQGNRCGNGRLELSRRRSAATAMNGQRAPAPSPARRIALAAEGATAAARLSCSRTTPAARDRIGRIGAGSAAGAPALTAAAASGRRAARRSGDTVDRPIRR